jgi:dethiobiotin synthetase
LRLGCINHALLTAEAIVARGLRLAGWVGNRIERDMPWAEENVATLRQWLFRKYAASCLGVVPWLADATPAAVGAHLDAAAIGGLLTLTGATFEAVRAETRFVSEHRLHRKRC